MLLLLENTMKVNFIYLYNQIIPFKFNNEHDDYIADSTVNNTLWFTGRVN